MGLQLCGHRFGVNIHQIGVHTAANPFTPNSVKRSSEVLFYSHSVDLYQIGIHTAASPFTPKQCKRTFGGVFFCKITPPKIFLHCFGVNGIAAVWTPIWY
jgi:hypothetical protein